MTDTILVTGSSRGIGRAVALRLARDGYDVVVHYHSRHDAAAQVVAEIQALGRQARVLQFDIADRAGCAAALEADIAAHGAYYGVVCNAGIARDAAFPAMSGEQWDSVIRTNLDSFYNVLQPVVMPMVRRRAPGRIVTLASVSGIIGNRGQANYSAAKGGIIAATKALAVELAKREITVNCVAPGLMEGTRMMKRMPAEVVESTRRLAVLQRSTAIEDVAAQVVAFCRADSVTGQVLNIDAGVHFH